MKIGGSRNWAMKVAAVHRPITLPSTLAGTSPDIRYSFHAFDTRVQESLLRERLMATLSGVFGALAMVLTAAGLYGVISYMVARRTSEIGIRVAIGAGPAQVIKLVLGRTFKLLAAGSAIGLVLAIAGRGEGFDQRHHGQVCGGER